MLESGETSAVLRVADSGSNGPASAVATLTADLVFGEWAPDGRPLGRASAPATAQAAPSLPGNGVTQLQGDDHDPDSQRADCADTHAQWDGAAKALHGFASAGDVEAMSALLQSTALKNGEASLQRLLAARQPASGATALHQLAAGAVADEADAFATGLALLLSHGLAVDCRAGNGSTPLHWAAGANGTEACRALLREGADVFAVTYTWNRQIFGKGSGRSPLHWAAEAGAEAAASVLLEASAGAGAGLPDERGLLAAEVAAGEGHSALHDKLEVASKQRFVVLEVEKLGSDTTAHGHTAPHLDIGGPRVAVLARDA
jgi:ankyrin repeat protein